MDSFFENVQWMDLLIFNDRSSFPDEFVPVQRPEISIYEVYFQFKNLIEEKTFMIKLLVINRSI